MSNLPRVTQQVSRAGLEPKFENPKMGPQPLLTCPLVTGEGRPSLANVGKEAWAELIILDFILSFCSMISTAQGAGLLAPCQLT